MCEQKRNCDVCDRFITGKKYERFKPRCKNCDQNKEVGHFCYMKPLKNELPRSDDVLFVFYDFETTQNKKFSFKANVHIPMFVCLQQFCTACEMQDDIEVEFERCGRRRHSFFEDLVGTWYLISANLDLGVKRSWR